MLMSAKESIYIEHQYPFQNAALTYYMCEALRTNPKLFLIVITPIKTDLPGGIVGDFIDWSQDHIIDHLQLIYNQAPERVGVYGLVSQDEENGILKSIYVHTKVTIVDGKFLVTGSTNMDNKSLFYSSELSVAIQDDNVLNEIKFRLWKEHLGQHFRDEMVNDFRSLFRAFRSLSTANLARMTAKETLLGRPLALAPAEHYKLVIDTVYFPNKLSKLFYKVGLNTEDAYHGAVEVLLQVKAAISETSKTVREWCTRSRL